jgi:hypothetical protein
VNQFIFFLAYACGAFIFSIDEKTKQKNLDKIKAILIAGTRTHVFCRATHSQYWGSLNMENTHVFSTENS